MLEIFLAEQLPQLGVELRGGEVGRFDLADERERDVPAKIDRIIARKVVGLEHLDRQGVHRRDLVVFGQDLEMLLIRRGKRPVVGNASAARVGATAQDNRCGEAERCNNRTTQKLTRHDQSSRVSAACYSKNSRMLSN